MPTSVWRSGLSGTKIAVLANARTREGESLPAALPPRLQGADLIVTLGGMGARSALDQLEEIAPVLGVQSPGDDEDIRTRRTSLVLEGDGYRIGCVPDAVAAGLFLPPHPFIATDDAPAICRRLFGGEVSMLLHATTRDATDEPFRPTRTAVNPGSVSPDAPDARPTFFRLVVGPDGCFGQHVWIA